MGEMINTYKILVGKREGKRPLGRPKRRWEESIRMDLGEIWWEVVDWFCTAKEREPSGSIKGREFLDQLSDC
jgi:hypothetical protein